MFQRLEQLDRTLEIWGWAPFNPHRRDSCKRGLECYDKPDSAELSFNREVSVVRGEINK